MNTFIKVVAIIAAIVAALALWARLPLRAALLAIIAAVLWSAQKRTLQRPRVLIAAAIAALIAIAANFVGPYSLALFDGR
ncbi:MAG: hypothetical protein ACREUE_14295 [Panacagrimonas sp.]